MVTTATHEFEPAFGFAANLCGYRVDGLPCAQIASADVHYVKATDFINCPECGYFRRRDSACPMSHNEVGRADAPIWGKGLEPLLDLQKECTANLQKIAELKDVLRDAQTLIDRYREALSDVGQFIGSDMDTINAIAAALRLAESEDV